MNKNQSSDPQRELLEYKKFVSEKLKGLSQIYASAAVGNFAKDVTIPKKEDEFTEFYVGTQVMLEVIREKIAELEEMNRQLEEKIAERTAALSAAQEKLAQSEQLFRTVFENAPIGIYILDNKGTILNFNPAMLKISGARRTEDIVGLNVFRLPSYKEAGLTKFFREGLAGKPFETEVLYTSYLGKKKTYRRYIGVPVFDIGGKSFKQLLLVVEDITARKHQESELLAKTEDLERVAKITIGRELQMIEFKKELDALKKEKLK